MRTHARPVAWRRMRAACARGDTTRRAVAVDDMHTCFFFFQAEDGIRDVAVTGVQTCALPIYLHSSGKPVIGARLVKHMGISAPAVTEAIHRLSRAGYVRVGRGKELTLTPKGDRKSVV